MRLILLSAQTNLNITFCLNKFSEKSKQKKKLFKSKMFAINKVIWIIYVINEFFFLNACLTYVNLFIENCERKWNTVKKNATFLVVFRIVWPSKILSIQKIKVFNNNTNKIMSSTSSKKNMQCIIIQQLKHKLLSLWHI